MAKGISLNLISKFDDKGIKEAQGSFSGMGSSLAKLGGIIAAAFSVVAIKNFTKESILAAEGVATANARLDQIAKSMSIFGDQTQIVSDRLKAYAEANELNLATDAEVIKATQAKLLTFKELALTADTAGGSFDRATQAAIDLAAAGFGSAEQNAVQLGKALNDPITGINALRRNGISFTEAEKEKIKVLVQSGQILEAQNVVLAAIETQVGGTAAATANASDKIKIAFNNVKETVGLALLPVFDSFSAALLPLIEYALPILSNFLNEKIVPFATKAAEAFERFANQLKTSGFDVGQIVGSLTESVTKFFQSGRLEKILADYTQMRVAFYNSLTDSLPGVVSAFIDFIPRIVSFFVNDLLPAMIKELTGIIQQLARLLVVLLPQLATSLLNAIPMLLESAVMLFNTLVQAVVEIVPNLIAAIIDLLPKIVDSIMEMLPGILKAAVDLFTALVKAIPIVLPVLIKAVFDLLPVIIDTLIKMLPELIKGAFQLFIGLVTGLAQATPKIIGEVIKLIPMIVKALIDNMPKLIDAGLQIVAGIAQGILENAPRLLSEAAGAIGNTLITGVKSLLGIRSPSKVFYEFGENVGEGLVWGILNSRDSIAAATKALIDSATRAAATALKEGKPYANYGKAQFETLPGGGTVNIGGFTDLINDMIRDTGNLTQGLSKVEKALGGTTAQLLDAMFEQQTFVRGNTQVITGTSEAEAASLIAQGFTAVSRLEKPIEEILTNINQVSEDFYREINAKFGRSGDAGLIPLAAGGFVKNPIPALVGEAGPELVIPLDRVESMFGSASKSQSGPVEININVQAGIGADPNTISREIIDAIKRYERINGPVFVSA